MNRVFGACRHGSGWCGATRHRECVRPLRRLPAHAHRVFPHEPQHQQGAPAASARGSGVRGARERATVGVRADVACVLAQTEHEAPMGGDPALTEPGTACKAMGSWDTRLLIGVLAGFQYARSLARWVSQLPEVRQQALGGTRCDLTRSGHQVMAAQAAGRPLPVWCSCMKRAVQVRGGWIAVRAHVIRLTAPVHAP